MASELTAEDANGIAAVLTELVADMTEKAKALQDASQHEMQQWATERANYKADIQYLAKQARGAQQVQGWGRVMDGLVGVVVGAAVMWLWL